VGEKQVLNEREVCSEYGLSIGWLRKARRLRRGPIFLKLGKSVRYRRADIEGFLIDHMVSTNEG
jgi:predicted DNA-binding transcriptional regulator AlpA